MVNEVRFDMYCPTCKYYSEEKILCDPDHYVDPDTCDECLESPFNYDSIKPINWEENT